MKSAIKLQFDKKIYGKAPIAAAARDLAEYAEFTLSDQGDSIQVIISPSGPDMRGMISGEFRNRVIYRNKVKK